MASKLAELLARKKAEAAALVMQPSVPSVPAINVAANTAPVVTSKIPAQTVNTPVPAQVPAVAATLVVPPPKVFNTLEARPDLDFIQMRLAELKEALCNNLPGFPTILKDIHAKLRADPEIVTLMSEEGIEIVVRGLEKHAQIEITNPKAAKAMKAASKIPVSADDL